MPHSAHVSDAVTSGRRLATAHTTRIDIGSDRSGDASRAAQKLGRPIPLDASPAVPQSTADLGQ